MHVNDAAQVKRLVKEVPILFVLFELLYLEGRSLMNEPYSERRAMLESLCTWTDGRSTERLAAELRTWLEGGAPGTDDA